MYINFKPKIPQMIFSERFFFFVKTRFILVLVRNKQRKSMMEQIFDRITIDDELCGGKPTIRGMRITVQTVLEFLFNDTTEEDILKQYPVLESEDIKACKRFAIELMNKTYKIKEIAA